MCVLSIAPGFHLTGTWAGRLSLGAGLDPVEGGLSPRPPWRTPDEAELASLVAASPGDSEKPLRLFSIPAHLRALFWGLLEAAGELRPDEAKGFFAEAARFLDYKRFSPPVGATYEVVLSPQGRPAVIGPAPDVWAVVNLGNEPTHAVFAAREIPARLRLEPGEGYRPPTGIPISGCTLGKEEPDLLLVIR